MVKSINRKTLESDYSLYSHFFIDAKIVNLLLTTFKIYKNCIYKTLKCECVIL